MGADGLRARYTGGTGQYDVYQWDPSGSYVQRTQQQTYPTFGNRVADTGPFEAWGGRLPDRLASTGGTLSRQDPVGYQGQWGAYSDYETGLVLMGRRYYDPGTGRFLTRDPAGYGGGINLYGFTGNNPVNEMDPWGMAPGALLEQPVQDPIEEGLERVWQKAGPSVYRLVIRPVGRGLRMAGSTAGLSATLFFMAQTRTADDSTGPGSPYAAAQARRLRNRASRAGTYGRPFHFREGVRGIVWQAAVDASPDGIVRDPTTFKVIDKNDNWVMGHRPGWEFRKHVESAMRRGINRDQFLEEYNNPGHYRPEMRGPNSSRKSEAADDVNYWP